MIQQTNASVSTPIENISSRQAATALGETLRELPQFQEYIQALKTVQQSEAVQRMSKELAAQQRALQWGSSNGRKLAGGIERLEQEIEKIPAVREFRFIDQEIRRLFREIDAVVSSEAGIEFARNAQRASCCGG